MGGLLPGNDQIKYLACSCHGNCPKVPGGSVSPNPCYMSRKQPSDSSPWAEMAEKEATEPLGLPYPSSNFRAPRRPHAHRKWHHRKWFQGCITHYLFGFFNGTQPSFVGGPHLFSLGVYPALGSPEEASLGSSKQIWGPRAPVVQRGSVDLTTKQGLKNYKFLLF